MYVRTKAQSLKRLRRASRENLHHLSNSFEVPDIKKTEKHKKLLFHINMILMSIITVCLLYIFRK